jgi:integrase
MSKFTYTTRKDGRFQKTLQVNGIKKYFVSSDEKELEKMYNEAKYLSDKGVVLSNDNISFKQYAERWFKINCTTKELATQESIKNRLNHLYDYIGNIKLKNLKPYHIQNFVTEMVSKGYTDVTKRSLAECRRILNDAIINDIIMKNVAIGINTPKFAKTERIPLTIEQDKKVYECALHHKYGLFILILRYCGLRPEEAVALTLEDIEITC